MFLHRISSPVLLPSLAFNLAVLMGGVCIQGCGAPQSEAPVEDSGLEGDTVEKPVTDPNTKDADGRTSLMLAAFDGQTERIRTLLEQGARVNDRDAFGRTALMYAASGPNPETVRLLLENGADPLLADDEEKFTALMFAAAEGQTEVVRVLLVYGSDPEMTDVDGDTAFDFAESKGHAEVAELLRSHRPSK